MSKASIYRCDIGQTFESKGQFKVLFDQDLYYEMVKRWESE